MSWKLFLDDIRELKSLEEKAWEKNLKETDPHGWVVCRNLDEVQKEIKERGCFPCFISFDHDLGLDENGEHLEDGYDLAKYLVDKDIDEEVLPENFDFQVHSDNPPGKIQIESLLNNYLKFKRNQK